MRLKIELQSDLCAGSGQGYSTVIDTDIIYDRYGLPYIPARRLKGCLREAAEYIGISPDKINAVFGESGQGIQKNGSCSGDLRLSNAVTENQEALAQYITKNNIPCEKVLALFTAIRAQTALEESGTAKENSLRFTRVVSQYYNNNNLCFFADVEVNPAYKSELEKAVKALRHIGYKRNRGLGLVKCSLVDSCVSKPSNAVKAFLPESDCRLDYVVELCDDVMLSNLNDYRSIEYIPGTSVLGALASLYLKSGKPVNTAFEDIFLKDVVFGNLFWFGSSPSCPVPLYVGKVKGEDQYVNMLLDYDREKKTVKQEKGKYLGNDKQLGEVQVIASYHNSNVSKRLEDPAADGGLYLSKCIAKKQKFAGAIYGKYKYLAILKDLMLKNNLRFGKSKSAQYSECVLSSIAIGEDIKTKVTVKQGQMLCMILHSDAALINDIGQYTTSLADLAAHIQDKLNKYGTLEFVKEKSMINGNTIGGYSGIWNLKKPQIPVFCAGSVVTFRAKQALDLPSEMLLGEKNAEGFGLCSVCTMEQLDLPKGSYKQPEEKGSGDFGYLFYATDKTENIKASAYEYAKNKQSKLSKLTSSNIGRLLLMVNKATDYDNLQAMIAGIAKKDFKETAEDLIKECTDADFRLFYKTVFTYGKNVVKTDKKIRGDK